MGRLDVPSAVMPVCVHVSGNAAPCVMPRHRDLPRWSGESLVCRDALDAPLVSAPFRPCCGPWLARWRRVATERRGLRNGLGWLGALRGRQIGRCLRRVLLGGLLGLCLLLAQAAALSGGRSLLRRCRLRRGLARVLRLGCLMALDRRNERCRRGVIVEWVSRRWLDGYGLRVLCARVLRLGHIVAGSRLGQGGEGEFLIGIVIVRRDRLRHRRRRDGRGNRTRSRRGGAEEKGWRG